MNVPEDLRYSTEHEWARALDTGAVDDALRVRVGITDFAQDSLGDVVFVDLPTPGTTVAAGEALGELESTKSVSDVYSPLAGTVVAVNEALAENPQLLNEDPYGEGWLFELELADRAALDNGGLLDAAGYRAHTEG